MKSSPWLLWTLAKPRAQHPSALGRVISSLSAPQRHRRQNPLDRYQASSRFAPIRWQSHVPAYSSQAPARPLEASVSGTLALVVAVAAAAALVTAWSSGGPAIEPKQLEFEPPIDVMAAASLPGRPGNLTPEQEEKLRKLWQLIFQLCGVADEEGANSLEPKEKEEAAPSESDAPKKKRFGVFRRKGGDSKSGTSTPTSTNDAVTTPDDDKYGQTKHFYETLANETPESIRATIWSMVKHDHPDALALRFLRARKWDVDRALVMFVSTMNWRHNEMHVDDDIMKRGDEGWLLDEKSAEGDTKQVSHDILEQLRIGKSFLHGTDKEGRPICSVRVRLHRQGEQCEESLEKYTVYIIETCRMMLSPPVDTACIIFDMTNFSMANMDYAPLKFMIKCFEANYPESLGTVLVHKAPWIFQGIWKVIRGWLDPVVAAKVHFTNNRADLEEYIEPGNIIKELDGDEDWEYKYTQPGPNDNAKLKDTATRDRLLSAREELVKKFEQATREWIRHPEGAEAQKIKAEREKLATELRDDYWNLDPYLRARTLYDRQGLINSVDGKVGTASDQVAVAPETSADDVD